MFISVQKLIVMLVLVLPGMGQAQQKQSSPTSKPTYMGTFFHVSAVNPRLPNADKPPNLSTPQACVEHFILNCRREQWLEAARALNLKLLEPMDETRAARQAEQLHYLLNQNLWIDWSLLPDRPDGKRTSYLITGDSQAASQPRRSIELGTIVLNGRDIPIRVERVKPEDGPPVWLFAAQTVDNIELLYKAKGPSWLAQQAPEWSRQRLLFRVPLWQWLALATMIGLAILIAWIVVSFVSRTIAARMPSRGGHLIEALRWPAAILTAGLFSQMSIGSLLTLPGGVSVVGAPVLMAIVVFSATWLIIRVMGFLTEGIVHRSHHDQSSIDESGLLARLTVFRYVLIVLVVSIGLSVLLISMDLFRTLGIALLGSAGAAAVVLGIAGHAVLGNLIAGLQIALARPFRIGDMVIVEGYWGWIEELRYTFVAVRTWDQKRIVLPVKYFMSHWFENWSKTDQYLVKPIYLKVDYRANVQAIREQFLDIVKQDEDWAGDRDNPEALVTESDDETMTVRLTCGGNTPSAAWDLSCRVREKVIAWLQQYEDGRFLPRQRVVLHQHEEDTRDSTADKNNEPETQTVDGNEG